MPLDAFAAGLVADVRVLWPQGLNTRLYLDANALSRQTAWAHSFMHAYALWLGPVVLAALFFVAYAVAWWRRASHATALLVLGGAGTVIALGLNQVVGHAARELRPYASHPHALVLVGKTSDFSFPSDHSIVAGGLTLALALAMHYGRRRAGGRAGDGEHAAVGPRPFPGSLVGLAVILGLFLCFARVYVGAHYPGDVVAGYLLSALVAGMACLLVPVADKAVAALDTTVLGVAFRRPDRRRPAHQKGALRDVRLTER
ncbi:MAG TPA: phosphatase PAP2 family protein [Acidimicrobiales bacterium]|nr:phosphatase PAP2 family protein [Acidimicrobiales bacterium]